MNSLFPLFTAALLVAPSVVRAHPHPADDAPVQYAAANNTGPARSTAAPAQKIVSGSGAFRYEFVREKLALPSEVRMKHGHGLCRDAQDNIYFTYEPQQVDAATRTLVRFDPDGTNAKLLGSDNALAHGQPHGLNIFVDAKGQAHLFHANNAATVHATTLDGEVEWTRRWPDFMGNYKPTDAVVPPGGSRVLVADGYGSSMIHALNMANGVYAGKSWGGTGAAHGELNCPHGIAWDARRKLLLIADRGNSRLEYYTANGLYHSTVSAPEIKAPCNADVQGDYVLVPNLDGPLVILDPDNRTASVIEVGKLLGDEGFKHPHDAIWLANGDIVVCTWNPGRLGYWRKVPNDGSK